MSNRERENWPNFFIVGAPRAGTTALYEYLQGTPGVFLPKIKELNYFSQSIDKKYFLIAVRDKKKYLNYYKNVSNEIAVGDCSPSYLRDILAPNLIHDVNPDAKIIIMLRNPIERAFSHYLTLIAYGTITASFNQAIKDGIMGKNEYCKRIINSGLYYEQVKRYCDTFGKNQVQIFIFEEFVKDMQKGVKKILDFLGVKNDPPSSIDDGMINKFALPKSKLMAMALRNNKLRKIARKTIPNSFLLKLSILIQAKDTEKPEISLEDRKLLEDFYRPDVLKLEDFLNKKMTWF